MSTNSFGHPRPSLLRVALCVLLAAACDSAPAPTSPSPSPTPAPTPEPTEYRVSGIVRDAADGAPIASATVVLRYTQGELRTRTDADGAYTFSVRTSQPYRNQFQIVPGDFLGLLAVGDGAYLGDIGRGHWTTVQLLPWTPEVVHNVRLRPVRTLTAGQSMGLSVAPDSSLVWDKEWDPWVFPSFDALAEEFRVSVQTNGLLTIDVRPEAGDHVATLTCPYVGCPAWRVQGTVSIPVEARWSPFYFSVEIPRASAPQRYEIQTSLR